MTRLRRCIALTALFLLGIAALAAAPAPDFTLQPPGYPFHFIAYGDIRFTNPGNTRVSNPMVREALVEKIAAEKPAFVVITGDIVLEGANPADWAVFERETQPWRQEGLKVFPALGNHDVRGGESAALANYFEYFPALHEHRLYSVRDGNLMLFVLDSNSDDAPGSLQGRWLAEGLKELPREVDFVVIALHHPPYTESFEHLAGGGHNVRPPEKELADLLEKQQSKMRARMVVVAGHVHNYERYEHGGVMYIVSGGGGATPDTIQRKPGDFYTEPGPTYHYCRFTVERGVLKGQMVKYLGQNQWAVKDQFELRPN
jgi:predicted MPP superfamily phosphohydrolase